MTKPIRPSGFTLLELLIVMTIVGILTAVSLPRYAAYRAKAFDVRAQSDLRSVALAEEAYFIDWEAYKSCAGGGCTILPGIRSLSPGVILAVAATPAGFVGTASHPKGSGKTFHWSSNEGGITNVD